MRHHSDRIAREVKSVKANRRDETMDTRTKVADTKRTARDERREFKQNWHKFL